MFLPLSLCYLTSRTLSGLNDQVILLSFPMRSDPGAKLTSPLRLCLLVYCWPLHNMRDGVTVRLMLSVVCEQSGQR